MIAGMKRARILIAGIVFFVNATTFAQQRLSETSAGSVRRMRVGRTSRTTQGARGPDRDCGDLARVAARLAYYKAKNGFGILGPRGWHCFSTYGSNGSTLVCESATDRRCKAVFKGLERILRGSHSGFGRNRRHVRAIRGRENNRTRLSRSESLRSGCDRGGD